MSSSRYFYNPSLIVDAPEFHELSRALGVLTWSTWDHARRSFNDRREDFVASYPPTDPTRYTSKRGAASQKSSTLNEDFVADKWQPGALHEILSRYGLKYKDGPVKRERPFEPSGPLREVARRRNRKLRVLHGTVDIEAKDMDAAKADFLEKEERRRAAQEIRAARRRMRKELESS